MWEGLDTDAKNVYKKRTEAAKKEYLKALAAYRANAVSQEQPENKVEPIASPPPTAPVTSPHQQPHKSPIQQPQQTHIASSVPQSPQHQQQQQQQIIHQQQPQYTSPPHQNNYVQQQPPQYMAYQSPPTHQQHPQTMPYHGQDVYSNHQQQTVMMQQVHHVPNPGQYPPHQQLPPNNFVNTQICIRHGCNNPAIVNPDWEDEYCSNECVVNHCR